MHLIIHGFELSMDNSNEALSQGIYSLLHICQQFKLDADGFWVSDLSLKKKKRNSQAQMQCVEFGHINVYQHQKNICRPLYACGSLPQNRKLRKVSLKQTELSLFIVFLLTGCGNKGYKKRQYRCENSKHPSLRVKMKL